MYHLSIKPVARGTGRSATAAAAYRAACVIEDERTGDVHDYTKKGGVKHSEILLPAGSPNWESDRAALWNAAERAEKRIDSRVAREYEVALPKELSLDQGIALVRDFGYTLIERYGVAVDYSIHQDHRQHWDGSEKGFMAYHAHVLTTTRKLGRDGFGEKAVPELSDTKRKSLGLDSGAAEIERVRELWAVVANRHLDQAGHRPTLDHRSLEDQGIDREPTVHLGPVATALERGTRGRAPVATRLGDANRRIEAAYRRGQLERQAQGGPNRSVLALDGDISQALAERERLGRGQGQGAGAVPAGLIGVSGAPESTPAPDYLRMKDVDIARLVGTALESAIDAHRQKEQAAQLRMLTAQSVAASGQLPYLRDELAAIEARAPVLQAPPVAPRGLSALFRRKASEASEAAKAFEASQAAHVIELDAARARLDAVGRRVMSPELRQAEARRLAEAQMERQLPLSLNALAEQQDRARQQQVWAGGIVNQFKQHVRQYGALADNDPRWLAQSVWLQGQIRDFAKASHEGGASAFLARLQQEPERLVQLKAAIKEGRAQVNALERGTGRGR